LKLLLFVSLILSTSARADQELTAYELSELREALFAEYEGFSIGVEAAFLASQFVAKRLSDAPFVLMYVWDLAWDDSLQRWDGFDPASFRVFIFDVLGSSTTERFELRSQERLDYSLSSGLYLAPAPVRGRLNDVMGMARIIRTTRTERAAAERAHIRTLIRSMESEARPVLNVPRSSVGPDASCPYQLKR